MIPLLQNFRDWDNKCIFDKSDLHSRSFQLLEWQSVLAEIAKYCVSKSASEQLLNRYPYTDIQPIQQQHLLIDELREDLIEKNKPPLIDVSDLKFIINQETPFRLEGADIVAVASTAKSLDNVREWLLSDIDGKPVWSDAASSCPTFFHLSNKIFSALTSDGEVKDSASPLLAKLRKEIRSQEQQVRSEANKAMKLAREKGWANADEVTIRGDRFCVPLRSGDKQKINGIVLDRSGSGGTIFVEPANIVLQQNSLVETKIKASAEEQRIILELTSLIEQSTEALTDAISLQTKLDETCAVLIWGQKNSTARPMIAKNSRLKIASAKHPLLLAQMPIDEVKPLDYELPAQSNVILVSGPNAGGKSVMLKCTGLMILLAQCGWDIPADHRTELPLVKQLFVDIGDEQSISNSLSSYSAHLENMSNFLKAANSETVVLCDELGGGTDPDEGSVLAFVMLEKLAELGATVLATTHYGLLKASVNEHQKMTNAAMDFDEKTMSPLFTIRVGIPGGSHAFAIAEKMSVPVGLLKKAADMLGDDRVQLDKLLSDLNQRNIQLAESLSKSEKLKGELEKKTSELNSRLSGIDDERKQVIAKTRAENEVLLKESRRRIERVVKSIKESNASKDSVVNAQKCIKDVADKQAETEDIEKTSSAVSINDFVRVAHLNLDGQVIEIRENRVVVDADGVRVVVDITDLTRSNKKQREKQAVSDFANITESSATEIDLRGLTAEEAWDSVDLFIDRAILGNMSSVDIIHGTGTGRLRTFLHTKFKSDTRVASYEHAPLNRGGEGVTVLILA